MSATLPASLHCLILAPGRRTSSDSRAWLRNGDKLGHHSSSSFEITLCVLSLWGVPCPGLGQLDKTVCSEAHLPMKRCTFFNIPALTMINVTCWPPSVCLISGELTTWVDNTRGIMYHDSPPAKRHYSCISTLLMKKLSFRAVKLLA